MPHEDQSFPEGRVVMVRFRLPAGLRAFSNPTTDHGAAFMEIR
jgi:hypothetical protein